MKYILSQNNRVIVLVDDESVNIEDWQKRGYKSGFLKAEEVDGKVLVRKFPYVEEWEIIPLKDNKNTMEMLRIDLFKANKNVRIKKDNESSESFLKGL
jgi:hypothetical protein